MRKFIGFLGLVVMVASLAWATPRTSHIDYAGSVSCSDTLAARAIAEHSVYIVGYGANGPQYEAGNPNVKFLFYDSPTDDKIPSAGYNAWDSTATAAGIEPESLYCHWSETTKYLASSSCPDTITVYAGDRVEGYYVSCAPTEHRFMTRFNSPGVKEAFVDLLMAEATNYDGIFLDNCAHNAGKWPTPISGGHIQENPNVVLSSAFNTWFIASRDTFTAMVYDSLHAHNKVMGRNIGTFNVAYDYWNDIFITGHQGDIIFCEYTGSPQNINWGPFVPLMYTKSKALEQVGKYMWYGAKWLNISDGDTLSAVYSDWVMMHAVTYQSGFSEPMSYGACCNTGCVLPSLTPESEYYRLYWTQAVDELRHKMTYPTSDITEPISGVYKRTYTNGEIYIYPSSSVDSTACASITLDGTRYRLRLRDIDSNPITSLELPKGRAVCVLKPDKNGNPPEEWTP